MKTRHLKQVIIVSNSETREAYGSLSDLIAAKGWPNWPIRRWKFPFEYAGWLVEKKSIK